MQEDYILKKRLNQKIDFAIQYYKVLQVISSKFIKKIELVLN